MLGFVKLLLRLFVYLARARDAREDKRVSCREKIRITLFWIACVVIVGALLSTIKVHAEEMNPVALAKLSAVRVESTLSGASGSGVIVAPGLVVTAAHVVVNDGRYWVKGGSSATQGVVSERRSDKEGSDWAFLNLGHSIGEPATVRCSSLSDEEVFTVQSPGETFNLVIRGGVSHVGWDVAEGIKSEVLIDAATGPGGSGGGVFDASGRLVGIILAIWTATMNGPVLTVVLPVAEIGEGASALCPS